MKRKFHLKCKTCGKDFIGNASNIKYCSEKCFPKVKCDQCGILFIPVREKIGHKFCSRSCASKYQMSHLSEEQKLKLSKIGRKNIQKANEYWNTEEGRKRKSQICSRTNSTPERAALVSKQWENKEFKEKMTQSVIERWKNGVYGALAIDNLRKINMREEKFCKEYNKITLHNGFGACLICNPNSEGFDRESFCKNKLDLVSFNSINQETSLDDFDSLKGELGVWSRWTDKNHGNYCLDVCKTKDIGSEMLSSLRSFNSLKENPNQELDIGWKKKYMEQAKDADIFNSDKIVFKLIAYCKSEEEALMIEAQYAHDNKAKY